MTKVERRKYAREYMAKRVEECRKAGICWRCKDEAINLKPTKGKKKSKTPLCAEHLVYQREVMRDRRGSKPFQLGKPGRPPMFHDAVVADMRAEA